MEQHEWIQSMDISLLLSCIRSRVFTPQEIATSLTKAQAKGFPNDWTVEWNSIRGHKIWILPTGRKYNNLSQALSCARNRVLTP
jgi:hypothetical protein